MERPWSRLVDALRSPEAVTDGIQITKTVVAATAAWYVSTAVLGSPMPFLAPWTALLTVHATAYRSLSRGAQTTVASTAGVALSFVIGYFLGVDVWTFALAILVGLVVSRISWLRDEGVAIATTAIFILAGGFEEQAPFLDDRLLEVALGVAFGIIVNLAFLPPLRDRQAARYVDSMNRRMGEVMISMADELGRSWDTDRADTWVDETVAMDDELDSAWQTVRFARENRRLNRVTTYRSRGTLVTGGTGTAGRAAGPATRTSSRASAKESPTCGTWRGHCASPPTRTARGTRSSAASGSRSCTMPGARSRTLTPRSSRSTTAWTASRGNSRTGPSPRVRSGPCTDR